MRKRKHRDTTRLTARERMEAIVWEDKSWIFPRGGTPHFMQLGALVEAALQAHARQALARERLRQKGRR